jgi:hypothetical protein
MNYYYLDSQNREIGPVPIDAIRTLRAAGALTDNTLARPEAGGPWSTLGALLGANPASTPSVAASPAVSAASAALADARSALKHLFTNPALGLPEAWKELGPKRSLAAGLAMIVVALVLAVVLVKMDSDFALIRPYDLGGWLKLVIASAGSIAVYIAVLFGLQRATGGTPGVECGVFIVGAVSLLVDVLGLGFALLGMKNIEVLIALAVAVACIAIIQLFIGLTRLGGVKERAASLVIPLALIAMAWGTKIIFSAIY